METIHLSSSLKSNVQSFESLRNLLYMELSANRISSRIAFSSDLVQSLHQWNSEGNEWQEQWVIHIHMLMITLLDFRVESKNPGQSLCAEREILLTQSIIVIERSKGVLSKFKSVMIPFFQKFEQEQIAGVPVKKCYKIWGVWIESWRRFSIN